MKFSGIHLSQSLPPIFGRNKDLAVIFPINAQLVGLANKNIEFLKALRIGTCVVDGQVLLWAVNLRAYLLKLPKFNKLSGSDLIYKVSEEISKNDKKLLLLGASEDANAKSVEKLKNTFDLNVVGYSPPFSSFPFPENWVANVANVIIKENPNVIFFAFGAPKQEILINQLYPMLKNLDVELIMAVGGSLDFLSGTLKRAPKWVQMAGLEGLYRFIQQPSNMRLRRIMESILAIRFFFK